MVSVCARPLVEIDLCDGWSSDQMERCCYPRNGTVARAWPEQQTSHLVNLGVALIGTHLLRIALRSTRIVGKADEEVLKYIDKEQQER